MANKKTNDLVPIYIPLLRGEQENYVVVSINGKKTQIMKGVQVYVKPEIAEVLNASAYEENALNRKIDSLIAKTQG